MAEVSATGARTKFGRTAELVRAAHVVSTQQSTVFRVVRNIAAFNGVLVLGMTGYAYFLQMPIAEIVPLILTAVLASIPVALPATFTLAAALGARNLAKLGVLPTRLSAVDEAGTMDVLCADKTGTLTRNELTVGQTRPMGSFTEADVLSAAAFASAEGGQDPVDLAIRAAAAAKGGRRQIQARLVRALRSGQAHVGGNGYGLERRDAAHREGRVRNRDRPRRAVAVGGSGGEGTRIAGHARDGCRFGARPRR